MSSLVDLSGYDFSTLRVCRELLGRLFPDQNGPARLLIRSRF
jgi:hypothetical protein